MKYQKCSYLTILDKSFFIALAFIFLRAFTVFASEGLEVHFLNVGQADAVFITCDGHMMLIDGGSPGESQFIYSYLESQKVSYLDYIVATHADADHVGGLSAAVAYAGSNIGRVLSPYTDSEKERFKTFKRRLSYVSKEINVPKVGEMFELGSAKFQVLSGVGFGPNESLVLRLTYGKHSFLFTGDAEHNQEISLAEGVFHIESTVLKIGHHGSNSSSCYPFLRKVNPKYAVISVGRGNSYGHPDTEVLERLRDAKIAILRTDINGTIIFQSDGETLTFSCDAL